MVINFLKMTDKSADNECMWTVYAFIMISKLLLDFFLSGSADVYTHVLYFSSYEWYRPSATLDKDQREENNSLPGEKLQSGLTVWVSDVSLKSNWNESDHSLNKRQTANIPPLTQTVY